MARRTFRQTALVLARTKLGEHDLILTLLGQDGSQVRAVAKGARRPQGRLASRVELFCETDFLLAAGRNLDIVSEATLADAHAVLRGDLARVSAASMISEVARLTSFEETEDPFLFAITSRALRACEQAADQAHLDLVAAAYAFKVCSHAGWRPELEACMACADAAVSFFSTSMGGLLCSSCARSVEGATELSTSEVATLRALLSATFDELLARELPDETAALMLSLAHGWCALHLDARMRAFEFALSL